MRRALAAILILLAVVTGGIVLSPPAQAASPGAGFGTWAPTSTYGWHGSMLVGGVHTYCIFPGRPLPVGESADHGVSFDAAGLDPQRLTAINMLVSTYGQTDDPVQAASVGWAVKAIANWDETLHHFGYPGDSLEGAIHWTFSALAPEHSAAVQHLAAAYYAEATAMAAGRASGSGALRFTAASDDPSRGTVTVETDTPDARGTVTLEGAVFADTGSPTRTDAVSGGVYDIVGAPEPGASSYTVRGSGTLHAGFLPAVRHFTTPGGQDTAGPGGQLEFPVEGADEAPRTTVFAPEVHTQVVSRYVPGGAYVDDVTFTAVRGAWGRTVDGGHVPVTATAVVYRTPAEPVTADRVPDDAEEVGTLSVTTDPGVGPTAPYRVEAPWPLPGPGFYTAVWRIDADGQAPETVAALEEGYRWVERFGERSQVMAVTEVRSEAEPVVAVGSTMSDVVIVAGAVPAAGLDVGTEVFRVPDGVEPADACRPEHRVWGSAPTRVAAAGSVSFTAPAVPGFGTYVWREWATDADGLAVHTGVCGIPNETTRAPLPTVTTLAQAGVGLGGEVTDLATVTGPVPVVGSTELVFEVFRSPGGDPAAACTPETLVATTEPVAVTGAGEFRSPAVRLSAPGTHFWVESLWHTTPEGERMLLAHGTCGVPDETTEVETPQVVTAADPHAGIDAPYADTAEVTGLGDGVDAELVFTVHHVASGAEPVCTPENLEATTAAVPVDGPGRYRSPEVRSGTPGTKLWIAELRIRTAPGAEPIVVHRGGCGEDGESTRVERLAVTGTGDAGPVRLWAGAGLGTLAVGGALTLWAALRRRHRDTLGGPRFGLRRRTR
ncbi:hypothetical protein [Microbacterium sp. GXF7504]